MEVNLFVDDGLLNPCWPCYSFAGLFKGQQECYGTVLQLWPRRCASPKKGCDILDLRIAGFGHSAIAYSNVMQHAGVAARPVAARPVANG